MKTVLKYKVEMVDLFTVAIPAGAEFLCVQTQNSQPQMWFRVDGSQPLEDRQFSVVGTGNPISLDGRYLGTFQLAGGQFVFHLFGQAGQL